MFWSKYRKDRRDLREARTATELAWLTGEKELIATVFKEATAGQFERADHFAR